MSRRDSVALRVPDGRDLSGFPITVAGKDTDLYRAHRNGRGAWYFSASGAGRFDLEDPRGTCYLAIDLETAVREALGATLHALGAVDADFAVERSVSRLRLPRDRVLADLCHRRAVDFGVTREIHALTPYMIPRAWAGALDAMCDGLRYQSRFSTVPTANALAVFDDAGSKSWPADNAPTSFTVAARDAGIAVLHAPNRVTIVPPPA
ncbi:RES family NAD+ phosphorylase [Gordonia rhizosphera]|uniref:RES family NAD+ phosphorylase n=1 Tax=Gordonia rhizosphera TaxID=83341 RepID=UPI00058CBD96|nr:RES family NAD+ phosphorylase [Gordonia rhizosphera]